MDDTNDNVASQESGFWKHRRFLLLVAMSIVVSLVLVSISMSIYNSSGAADLDLSRPGYQGVTGAITSYVNAVSYSSSGPINAQSISDFKKLYNSQASQAQAVDAFGGDPLNPDSLGISAPSATTSTVGPSAD